MLLFGSFIASAILTALVRRYSLKVGFVSKPVEARYSNKTIALGGGIAIFITLAGIMADGAIAMKLATSLGMFESLLARLNVNTADFFAKINQLIILLLMNKKELEDNLRIAEHAERNYRIAGLYKEADDFGSLVSKLQRRLKK